jgi:hypothetical protein
LRRPGRSSAIQADRTQISWLGKSPRADPDPQDKSAEAGLDIGSEERMVEANGGKLRMRGCSFGNDGPSIAVRPGLKHAIVTGNDGMRGVEIQNEIGNQAVVANNKSEGAVAGEAKGDGDPRLFVPPLPSPTKTRMRRPLGKGQWCVLTQRRWRALGLVAGARGELA